MSSRRVANSSLPPSRVALLRSSVRESLLAALDAYEGVQADARLLALAGDFPARAFASHEGEQWVRALPGHIDEAWASYSMTARLTVYLVARYALPALGDAPAETRTGLFARLGFRRGDRQGPEHWRATRFH